LSDTAEWSAYIKSNPEKMNILDSKEAFLKNLEKNQSENLAQQSAEAYKKSIIRRLIDPKEVHPKDNFYDQMSMFSPSNGLHMLPQV